MPLLAEYIGGSEGWGKLIYKCSFCGEVVAEFETYDDGRPSACIFDVSESHVCEAEQ